MMRGPRRILAAAMAAAIALVAAACDDAPEPLESIPLDVWAPYWGLPASVPELPDRIDSMREVSPFWFNVAAADEIVVDPNAADDATGEFMAIAEQSDALIVPSIVDALDAGEMAAILGDPETRALHIDTLVAFAQEGDYDGLDLDYERFAFVDGRSTWHTTRPNWVVFVEQLAARLHDDGRTLTVSIPPVYDADRTDESGFWVYDYEAIVEHVDRIRIMAYDFSVEDAGPISPIEWVETAINGALETTDQPDKLVLGIPAYGRNWPVGSVGDCPEDAPGRTPVTARGIADLVERRGGEPVYLAETAESVYEYSLPIPEDDPVCNQTREVHFVDALGVRARMDLAREYRLGGVSLWALGFEDDQVWRAIEPTIADPFPTTTLASDEQ